MLMAGTLGAARHTEYSFLGFMALKLVIVQGRHDAEAALREAQEELAAQAESVRHLQQQLAAAEDTPIADNLTRSPAG